MGAHTSGTESIADHMEEEMLVQGLSGKRWLVLAIFAVAMFINEVPLFGDFRYVNTGTYIEYFCFFPLFYTSIHWLEEVGLYQTMLFSMVFQTLSVLVAKTAADGRSNGPQTQEVVGEVLSSIAQVYLFNGITKLTGTWFDNRFRPIATAIIIMASSIGQYSLAWISYYYQTKAFDINNTYDVFDAMNDFKTLLFFLNLILTVVIIMFFESKPAEYPTLSQQYYRQKQFEPHLDIKFLLQYKEFKVYAIICGFLFTAINVAQSIPFVMLFVEAQANISVYKTVYLWAPLVFLCGLAASAVILSFFNQTNESYKRYMMLLILVFAASIGLCMFAFLVTSPFIYIVSTLLQSVVCGALKLYLYEFMTEITFPVSPVFALAILNSLSGLLSLLV